MALRRKLGRDMTSLRKKEREYSVLRLVPGLECDETLMAFSRAGSLPQGICGGHKISVGATVRRFDLLAKAVLTSTQTVRRSALC
ncbi:hypothetical protein EMIT0P395_20557 [Pseudomonas sp. IT-P395]